MSPSVPELDVRPLTPTIGAEVAGIDLAGPLDEADVARLRALLVEHQVLFFRDQQLSPDAHVALARRFGEIDIPTFQSEASDRPEVLVIDQTDARGQGTDRWHADGTQRAEPPMASILHALQLPPLGGDTCFASMSAAYDTLSPPMQAFVDGLTAVHTLKMVAERTRGMTQVKLNDDIDGGYPSCEHPVVRIHPESGRKTLNVNSNWTSHIVGLSEAESDAVLSLLLDHVRSPDLQVRFRWTPGAVAFWDNRAVQHAAVADYDQRRVMQRVTVLDGDRPRGPE
jgi:taurine dioxygenase